MFNTWKARLLISKMASIAEQIRNLSRPEPTNFDPEEDDFDTTRAKLVSKDVGEELDGEKSYSSSLRKKNIALLADEDSKYHGRPVSRGELARLRGDFQDSDESIEDDEEDDSDEGGDIESDDDRKEEEDTVDNDKDDKNLDEDDDNHDDDDGEIDNDDDEIDDDDDDDIGDDDDDDDDDDVGNGRGLNDEEEGRGIDSFSSRREDEVEKGIAVKQQLSLWDNLLEYRIRIQKAMVLANKLPQSDNVQEFTSSNDINLKSVKEKERKSLMDLLYKLLTVQEKLLEGNPETRSILHPGKKTSKKDDQDDEEIPSDSEEEEEKESEEEETENIPSLKLPTKRKRELTQEEFSECITKRHAAFQSYRDSVISKWSEKTRLASGKLSSKSFSAFDKSALTQIKQILSDKPRLIKRAQLKRSSYRVLGKADKEPSTETEPQEQANAHLKDYDSEIFDDDDFYHQLLRELIERRTTTNTDDPIEMGRQWLELQKLRRKIKKKIDTKASKGRKLRYNIHSKLVGYMPPIETGTMPDSSRNELFSSLFGQSKPTEAFDVDVFR